jgi:hypothetical protein
MIFNVFVLMIKYYYQRKNKNNNSPEYFLWLCKMHIYKDSFTFSLPGNGNFYLTKIVSTSCQRNVWKLIAVSDTLRSNSNFRPSCQLRLELKPSNI